MKTLNELEKNPLEGKFNNQKREINSVIQIMQSHNIVSKILSAKFVS